MEIEDVPVNQIIELAKQQPDKLALVDHSVRLTYSALAQSISSVADKIKRHCANTDTPRVVVCSSGSAAMVINILAAQCAGAAYVPLELHIPEKRVDAIFADAVPCLILAEAENEQQTRKVAERHNVPVGITLFDENGDGDNYASVTLPSTQPPEQDLDKVVTEQTSAVLFFTSGSTGRPKGVDLAHAGYAKWFEGVAEISNVTSSDRVALTTNHSFDLSLGELLLGLVSGATLYVASQSLVRDPLTIVDWLDKNEITIWQSVPSLLKQIVSAHQNSESLQSLRLLLTCGEPLEVELVRKFKHNFKSSSARVLNLYGPVEASIQVAYCWADDYLSREEKVVPLGKPLKHAKLQLLNLDNGQQELCITGKHLAKRYLDQEKTLAAFITDRTQFEDDAVYYKTGDISSINELGDYTYQGRADSQIKLNGYRIETAEISQAICSETQASDAAVILHEGNNQKELVAFVVSEDTSKLNLRRAISKVLPVYMLPREIIFVPALPLTLNGKLDLVSLKQEYLPHG